MGMRDRFGSCLEDHLADFNITRSKMALIKQDAQNGSTGGNKRGTG